MARTQSNVSVGLFTGAAAPAAPIAAAERGKRGSLHKAKQRKQKTVYLPAELAEQLRIEAAMNGQEQSDIVAAALRLYFEEHGSCRNKSN